MRDKLESTQEFLLRRLSKLEGENQILRDSFDTKERVYLALLKDYKELQVKDKVLREALEFYKDNNKIRATKDKFLNHVALKALEQISKSE